MGIKIFCLCLKGVLVRIELRTKRASEKRGAEDETDKSNSKSETMDANRGSRRGIFGGCFVFWRAKPAREADSGAGDAEQFFKRSG